MTPYTYKPAATASLVSIMVKSPTAPTVAGSLLDAENDLVIVQKLMGHATIVTPKTVKIV
jgi:hypothetical protein